MSHDELCDLGAVALRDLIGRRQLSPRELVAACIARIEAVNPAVSAFVTTGFERALDEAREAERAVMEGRPLGPLHGLPIGIKDLTETAGMRTTYGSPLYADHVPAEDEGVAAAIRRAGAIVIGKTNTPEFGAGANTRNELFGPTRNPFDLDRTCGGSSGGSAVALACGMVPLATGSDLGGSLRIPAAFSGVVGFRSSPGLIPTETRTLGWMPLSVEGPMARDVADTALLLSVMAGGDDRDPLSHPRAEPFAPLPAADLSSLRVAYSADLGFAATDGTIRDSFAAAVARLAPPFAEAVERAPPLQEAAAIFEVLRAVNFVANHGERYARHRDLLGPNVRANVELGLGLGLPDVARAMAGHTRLFRAFQAFMADVDVLICPATPVPPFPVDQWYPAEVEGRPLRNYFDWLAHASALTLTGNPVVAVPCGLDSTGTPFGLQVCGRRGRDREVLAIAAALERHMQGIPELRRPLPDLDGLAGASARVRG